MSNGHSENSVPGSELLRRLIEETGQGRRFVAGYQAPRNPAAEIQPYELLASLGATPEDLSDLARAALDAIEEIASESDSSDWMDFRWKLSAFLHLEDIFEVSLFPQGDAFEVALQEHYFYLESRLCLAESMLAGLNGLYIASRALLRPFLEFTLLQNYYYRNAKATGSHASIRRYLAHGGHPSWNTVLNKCLPDDPFSKPIRTRAKANLRGLSESSSHPYHPDLSPLQHRASFLGHSLEGLYFWLTISFTLDSALWVYYANFPMLFHPVDVLRKFGYHGPVGILADGYTGELVKRSLHPSDYAAFSQFSSAQEHVQNLLEWVAGLPDLTDDEIRATWSAEDGPLDNLWQGYCLIMAKLRARRRALAFQEREEDQLSEERIRALGYLDGWKGG